MGFFAAIAACYARILDFGGRARRAEYWWFFLFNLLFSWTVPVIVYVFVDLPLPANAEWGSPDKIQEWLLDASAQDGTWTYFSYVFAAQLILFWLPSLSVTVRRLHDTDRSGWWIFKPTLVAIGVGVGFGLLFSFGGSPDAGVAMALLFLLLYLVIWVWTFTVLAWPGSYGNNRFGPDPIKGRKRPPPAHPAFAAPVEPEERAALEAQRKAEIKAYYRKNVLPSIQH